MKAKGNKTIIYSSLVHEQCIKRKFLMLKNCFSLRLHCRRSCFPYNSNNNNKNNNNDDNNNNNNNNNDDDDDELY